MNLIHDFLTEAGVRANQTAIIDKSGKSVTYSELSRMSAQLAGKFSAKGLVKGDRVLVGTFPGIGLYAGLAALWRLGAVAVFPEPAMGITGVRHAALVTQPKALLASWKVGVLARLFPEARRIPIRLSAETAGRGENDILEPMEPSEPALISFTSGSTGQPKAIERSHGLMRAQHTALAPLIAPERETEVDIVAFPAFVLTCIGHGTTAVMPTWNLRRQDRMPLTAVTHLAEHTNATRLLLPPVAVAQLKHVPLPSNVQRIMTGGGPLYPDVARQFLKEHAGLGLTNVYGSTEAEPIAFEHLENLAEQDWEIAATGGGLPVGVPVKDVVLRVHENEIQVAGPHVNRGYLDPSQNETTKIYDGDRIWHRTGDAGRLDDQGQLWLLGRHGASTDGLFAFAIETAARFWPGVSAAAFAVDTNSKPVLFLAGSSQYAVQWKSQMNALADIELVVVDRIPMDRRHRSKPDIKKLLADHR